ncbi:methyl-accepting chemotaxis protein [Thermovenabulum gondwanense]|uniref:Methyl-accepting chemotaxis protein McpB n=1 Tax=Thermovenabulum gondwanense TaxID=520767 RepID=A0A161Q1W9_9FIRM|nr:transporter substrate-binding domain-containing protein [Thermovenabulum gondwanense]KYO64338.1 Methyl-accepting chemotaxis protein McpB [Thermovenabulum gondwanense]
MIFKWMAAVNEVNKTDLLSVENLSFGKISEPKRKEVQGGGRKPENSFGVNGIKELIKGIMGKAEKYLSLLSRLSFSVEEISIAMKSIAEQSKVLTEAAKKQTSNILSTKNFTKDLYEKIEKTSINIKTVVDNSSKIYQNIAAKKGEVISIMENLNTLKKKLEIAESAVKNLEERSKRAGDLISSVKDISEETNLLALNAAIEAAHAGERGKSFSVVASEIRKLSYSTKEVSKEVSSLLNQIKEISNMINISIIEVLKNITQNFDKLSLIVNYINDIEKYVYDSTKESGNIEREISYIFSKAEEVNGFIENISKEIIEIENSTFKVDKAIEEQKDYISELLDIISKMEDNYIELTSEINESEFLQEKEEKLILVSSPYEPYVIYNDEKGELEGIDIEIIKEIFNRRNIDVVTRVTTWDMSLKAIKSGVADLIPTVSYKKEREDFIDFSKEYGKIYKAIYSLEISGVSIEKYDDLKKYKIGIIQGYNYDENFLNDRSIIKDKSLNEDILFTKLIKGIVDAVILNEFVGDYYLKNKKLNQVVRKNKYKMIEETSSDIRLGFSKKKDLSKYKKIFEEGIEEIKKDGTYERIVNKYLKYS